MPRTFALSVILVFILSLVGCAKKTETLRIAIAGPLTGNAAAFGEMSKRGAELKAEEFNSQPTRKGPKLELVFADDASDPKEASNVATKLAGDQSILIVIGHFNSSCTLASKPIYSREGVVEFSPGSTNVEVTKNSEWVFRNVFNDDFQGKFIARYLAKRLNIKTVAVFYDNDDYGRGLKQSFENEANILGIKIVGDEAYTRESTDFTPQLSKLKTLNPDLIFISGLYNEAALIASQARKMGIGTQLIGGDGVFSPDYIKIAGPASEGTLITCPFLFDVAGPEAKAFLAKFIKKYNIEPDWNAALTYDAVSIALEAINKVGPNRKAIRDYLAGMSSPEKGFKGISGLTFFDKDGDCQKPAYVSQVKNGKFIAAPLQMFE